MAAVSQDLPAIYNFAQYKASKNSEVYDANGAADRHPDQRPEQNPAQLRADLPQHQERGGLDRGRALLRAQRRRLPGHRPRPGQRHPQPERRPGRLDDHPAVRQAGAGSPGRPHPLRQVPGGGARLPARAPLEQGQDPHRVPEHDLLRRGRLRGRGRRPHLLRRRPPRLRHPDRALRLGARALGGGDAGGDHPVALGLRPQVLPRKRARPPQPGAGKDVRTGLHLARAARRRQQAGAARPGRHRAADARLQGALLHRLPAPAAGRTLRRLESLLRRPQGQVDARPAAAGSGRGSGQLLPRLLAGDRLGGRDRQPQRRHQGDGRRPRLRRPRPSTSPPRATASPAPRSSRSR